MGININALTLAESTQKIRQLLDLPPSKNLTPPSESTCVIGKSDALDF